MALNISQAHDVVTVMRGISGQEHDQRALTEAVLRLRNQAAVRLNVGFEHVAPTVGIEAGVAILLNDHIDRRPPGHLG